MCYEEIEEYASLMDTVLASIIDKISDGMYYHLMRKRNLHSVPPIHFAFQIKPWYMNITVHNSLHAFDGTTHQHSSPLIPGFTAYGEHSSCCKLSRSWNHNPFHWKATTMYLLNNVLKWQYPLLAIGILVRQCPIQFKGQLLLWSWKSQPDGEIFLS